MSILTLNSQYEGGAGYVVIVWYRYVILFYCSYIVVRYNFYHKLYFNLYQSPLKEPYLMRSFYETSTAWFRQLGSANRFGNYDLLYLCISWEHFEWIFGKGIHKTFMSARLVIRFTIIGSLLRLINTNVSN